MVIIFAILASAIGVTASILLGKAINKQVGASPSLSGIIPPGSLDPFPNDAATNKPPYGKIIAFSVLLGVGMFLVKFIGKKMNIKLLK